MLEALLLGILLGLSVSFTVGPAFFAIIQTSIDRGFKSALYIALGILICDAFLIIICYLGLSSLFVNSSNLIWIGFAGGIILIIFGSYTYLKKPDILRRRSSKYKTPEPQKKQFMYILKGFFLNFANPFVYVFWISVVSGVVSNYKDGEKKLEYTVIFFSGALLMIFTSDLFKSFLGFKIKKYLRPRIQLWINRIVGIILIAIGIGLMVEVIRGSFR